MVQLQTNMQLQQRINAFVQLGKFLCHCCAPTDDTKDCADVPEEYRDSVFFDGMQQQLELARVNNGWFTDANARYACKSWSVALSEENLTRWTATYDFKDADPQTVAIVMAGNVPLVGFHDFLSVLLCGHKVLGKLSSNDEQLLPFLATYLISIEPGFEGYITFTKEKLENFDAVIATGSNNTARYFEYYFGKYPHIIRNNRNSVAVLTGNETKEQLDGLAEDVFRYFGLGCRNVSKIFVPKNYNFDPFFNAMFGWKDVINESKYMNNYDYNKAVYLMSNIALLDNEFLLLKEDEGYASPISVVFYEYYDSETTLRKKLDADKEQIQCIVAAADDSELTVPFGHSQNPQLWDYADGVDTVDFLLKLSK